MNHLKPTLTGFLQVVFVTMTTSFIAKDEPLLASTTSFMISLMWVINVRHALSSWPVRISYCLGAAMGTYVGYYLSKWIQNSIS